MLMQVTLFLMQVPLFDEVTLYYGTFEKNKVCLFIRPAVGGHYIKRVTITRSGYNHPIG